MTLEEAWELAENLNEEAHQLAWDSWIEADELMESENEEDWIIAEEKREEASDEQAEHFRGLYHDLDQDQQESIQHWLQTDTEFQEQFSSWFGDDAFSDEFDFSQD